MTVVSKLWEGRHGNEIGSHANRVDTPPWVSSPSMGGRTNGKTKHKRHDPPKRICSLTCAAAIRNRFWRRRIPPSWLASNRPSSIPLGEEVVKVLGSNNISYQHQQHRHGFRNRVKNGVSRECWRDCYLTILLASGPSMSISREEEIDEVGSNNKNSYQIHRHLHSNRVNHDIPIECWRV